MKPFKTPSLVGKNTLQGRPPPLLDEDRPNKKRRISNADSSDDDAESTSAAAKVLKKPKTIPKFQPLLQKPVNTVANSNSSSSNQGNEEKLPKGQEGYYTVLWYVIRQLLIVTTSNISAGASSPPRRTRHGTATAYCLLPMATHDFRTSPAKISGGQSVKCHFLKALHFRSEARKSKSNR